VRHVYVLLTWHPALGLAASPAGVLGIETGACGSCLAEVAWLPDPGFITTLAWRTRLASPPTMATVTVWLGEDGACQLAEIPVPDEAVTLRDAAELTLDMLAAEILPLLPPADGAG
jgi:hypothetical protein